MFGILASKGLYREGEGYLMSVRTLVIVPAWNEEETIANCLRDIARSVPDADIVVVNDGSTDQTSQQVRSSGVDVSLLEQPFNLGVGAAMRLGYLYSARHGYTYTCQVDADGQHDPSYIRKMIAHLEDTGSDLVVGSRFAGEGSYQARGPRRWAMVLLSGWLSKICHSKLSDTTSGFKVTNERATRILARRMPAEYLGDTLDSLVILAKEGCKISETAVSMRERQGGVPSHSPLKSALFLFRAFFSVTLYMTHRRTGGE